VVADYFMRILLNMVNQDILAVAYGLAAASSWGTSDFSGGFVTKTSNVFGVLLVANITATALLTICALWVGGPVPDITSLIFGALAGIAGFIGLAAFYKGLASEHMGMVASLAAVISAALPVLFGMLMEGLPSNRQIVGFAAAFAAIWQLSVSEKSHSIRWRQLSLPATAGIAFGFAFILIDRAVEQSVFWPLLSAKMTGTVVLIILLLIFRIGTMPHKHKYPMMGLIGFFDAAGTTFYALAAQVGRLDISAVLASMHPAITAFLAWVILRERLSRRQCIGVVAALIAIALIAS
jgi:drug/metabolite transporter (DMT)-like permease